MASKKVATKKVEKVEKPQVEEVMKVEEVEEVVEPGVKRSFWSAKIIVAAFLIVLVLAAAVPSIYFYNEYQKSQELLNNPTKVAQAEAKELVAQVGKIIELPSEEPTIATVSDKNKLKDQPFFARAVNGDKVLIYTKAQKAILFRPSSNKIIEVAPVNLGSAGENGVQSGSQEVAGAAVTPIPAIIRIAILNGTKTVGLASTTEKLLEEKVAGVEVVQKGNAKNDHQKTIVVDLSADKAGLSGKNVDGAKAIAEVVGGEVGVLPEGETKTNADIVVILGK